MGLKLTAEPVYDWNCVPEDIFNRSSIKMTSTQCEKRCSEHKDCKSCLRGTGAEGGWRECRWSTRLNEVLKYFLLNKFLLENKKKKQKLFFT